MSNNTKKLPRRTFLQATTLTGGGLLLGFGWLAESCKPAPMARRVAPLGAPRATVAPVELNGYIKIAPNGVITILSPNPEIGQNVKTAMPMLVAEELDINWDQVVVEQAPLDATKYARQIAGGSQSIRSNWKVLRNAGATARHMLRQAAAQAWNVPLDEVTTREGMLYHTASGKSASYGSFATVASKLPVPEKVTLKAIKDFKIIGTPRKNVEGPNIVRGKSLYGIDYQREGLLIAMAEHPPAFGMQLKSFDAAAAKAMPGIKDVFSLETYRTQDERGFFDVAAFTQLVVVVGTTTWQVMQAKKALKVEWELAPELTLEVTGFGGNKSKQKFPAGLESTADHQRKIAEAAAKPGRVVRKDGDPEAVFQSAAYVLERSYTAPFLPHNCMEPMNFTANVTADKAELIGPIQTPEFLQKTVATRLGLPLDSVDIYMTRQGGGFGRRLYGHYVLEAALISQKVKAPVKLIYSREDDMTNGVYRPMYHANYRAAFDANKQLIGFQVKAGGIPEGPLHANRFPAGALEHYLAEDWKVDSNITIGAFRAPSSNFIAAAEQSFLDEVAEYTGQDPIQMRIDWFKRAQTKPVGKNNDYDPARFIGVLELLREKSGWNQPKPNVHRGVSAYYCHNSYVAQVVEVVMQAGKPVIQKVYCTVDCGIVVNPLAATNLVEGGIVDGIGHASYGKLTFKDGAPEQHNFDTYRIIRHPEAPKAIEVFFVKNETDPTGLGEPPYPPIMAALANALYRATGKRLYDQPFVPAES